MDSKNFFEFSEFIERIINKYNRTQNAKIDYGCGVPVTRTEIHTIEIIGSNPAINITQLAKIQGITKGAVSQMIYKLKDKGLVIKTVSPDSDAELHISLTEKGINAYNMHKKYHQEINKKTYEAFNSVSDEVYNQLVSVLKDFEDSLDKTLSSK